MTPERGGTGAFGAVLAAAGAGSRFGERAGRRKQYLEIAGRPLLAWSLDVFRELEDVEAVAIVAPPGGAARIEEVLDRWTDDAGGEPPWRTLIVEGGSRRQDSVRRGVERLWNAVEWLLVHDVARPLLRAPDVRRLMAAVIEHGAAALGHPATDSLQWVEEGRAARNLKRQHVWQVQTPQGASSECFRIAYGGPVPDEVTDEVSLLQAAGIGVRLVEGSRENIKITHPGDEEIAELLLRRRERRE